MGTSKKKLSVFGYTDYRKFLQDYFAGQKENQKRFSLRAFSAKAGLDQGNLSRVLAAKRPLTISSAEKITGTLKFTKRETDYFLLMVQYNEERILSRKKDFFKKMLSYKESSATVIPPGLYKFYDTWYYTAVREALGIIPYDGTNARELGRSIIPSITTAQVKQALNLLCNLGMVRKDEDGFYRRTRDVISTGHNAKALVLNNYIIKTMDLAKDAIGKMPGKMNLSALAITFSKDEYNAIQEELRECRKRILEIAGNSTNTDRVYMLNMQFFPVAERKDTEHR